MRFILLFSALFCSGARVAFAQQRDTLPADSAARADSIAQADSAAIERELSGIASEPAPALRGAQGSNPRQLPDISIVGDLVADLSPKGSTQEDGSRFGVREVEVAFQAAVDPYFRGDVFIGVHGEGVEIEQAFLTATALPLALEVRGGKFLMPLGKQNTTHRHDLHTVEYPHVLQRFLGAEGLKGTGLYVGRVFAPLGFYQELQLTVVDALAGAEHAHAEEHGHGEEAEELLTPEPANKKLTGLGYSARLRNYWDLSEATNLELSFSGATGKRAGGEAFCSVRAAPPDPVPCPDGINAGNVRQSLVGADVTFRWRPLQQGLFKSFILQGEILRQVNHDLAEDFVVEDIGVFTTAPSSNFTGAYVFARQQLTRRLFLGARGDWLEDTEHDGEAFTAVSAYLQFYPSEFSKLIAAFERTMPHEGEQLNRILVQATFALGPHKPHPF